MTEILVVTGSQRKLSGSIIVISLQVMHDSMNLMLSGKNNFYWCIQK